VAHLIVPQIQKPYNPTLGEQVCDFIEDRLLFGPGSLQGEQARIDDETRGLIYRTYELYPQDHPLAGTRIFDRVAWELRKGLAKSEKAAWIAICELHPEAPVRFNGFDKKGNLLRGRAVRSPYIPLMAAGEEQVQELTFGVMKYIIEHCDDGFMFDCSLERLVRLLPGGTNDGMAVPVSNAPATRDGARTTFQHFDEPHRLMLPKQKHAHETMIQNLPKRQLETPWALYTSTAGQPGQDSIEEDVRSEAEAIAEGKAPNSSLFFFGR